MSQFHGPIHMIISSGRNEWIEPASYNNEVYEEEMSSKWSKIDDNYIIQFSEKQNLYQNAHTNLQCQDKNSDHSGIHAQLHMFGAQ